MTDSASELERQLNELKGAIDLLFELREEAAQWVEEAEDGSKREAFENVFRPYRSTGERIPESPGTTAEESELRLVAMAARYVTPLFAALHGSAIGTNCYRGNSGNQDYWAQYRLLTQSGHGPLQETDVSRYDVASGHGDETARFHQSYCRFSSRLAAVVIGTTASPLEAGRRVTWHH